MSTLSWSLRWQISLLRGLQRCSIKTFALLTRQPGPVPITLNVPSHLHRGRLIRVTAFVPKANQKDGDETKEDKPLPVLINCHGGGFVTGESTDDGEWCARVARELGAVVLSVDYGLAPEEPFPFALEDVESVLHQILSPDPGAEDAFHPLSLKLDRDRISLCGFSAGGALVIAAACNDLYRARICSVLSFYGVLDVSTPWSQKLIRDDLVPDYPTSLKKGDPFNSLLDKLVPTYCDNYGEVARQKRCSPMFTDVSELPKELMIIAPAWDPLLDEQMRLVEKVLGRPVVDDDFSPPLAVFNNASASTATASKDGQCYSTVKAEAGSEVGSRITLHLFPRCAHGWNLLPPAFLGVEALRSKEAAIEVALESLRTTWRMEGEGELTSDAPVFDHL